MLVRLCRHHKPTGCHFPRSLVDIKLDDVVTVHVGYEHDVDSPIAPGVDLPIAVHDCEVARMLTSAGHVLQGAECGC